MEDAATDGTPNVIPPDAACATDNFEGSLMPLAMYVLLDRSQSMSQNDKWGQARTAFTQFVNSSQAAGIQVALTYFPNPGAECDGTGYETPEVPMRVLPDNATAIVQSLQTVESTNLGTPIEGALRGIQRFCSAYAHGHPGEKIVGVLITDGEPNGCDENVSHLTQIARSTYEASPPVSVFAVGMEGAAFATLDAIAQAGGTGEAFDVSQGGAQALLDALLTIAGTSLPCEFAVPTSSTGTVDPTKVNVKYTDASGTEQYLGQVAGRDQCVENAWYYDNAQQPTTMYLCPQACEAVRNDAGGKIDIVLGCATISPPPPR